MKNKHLKFFHAIPTWKNCRRAAGTQRRPAAAAANPYRRPRWSTFSSAARGRRSGAESRRRRNRHRGRPPHRWPRAADRKGSRRRRPALEATRSGHRRQRSYRPAVCHAASRSLPLSQSAAVHTSRGGRRSRRQRRRLSRPRSRTTGRQANTCLFRIFPDLRSSGCFLQQYIEISDDSEIIDRKLQQHLCSRIF